MSGGAAKTHVGLWAPRACRASLPDGRGPTPDGQGLGAGSVGHGRWAPSRVVRTMSFLEGVTPDQV
eukprot:386968-Pyramimonas_sp.AAC.1